MLLVHRLQPLDSVLPGCPDLWGTFLVEIGLRSESPLLQQVGSKLWILNPSTLSEWGFLEVAVLMA